MDFALWVTVGGALLVLMALSGTMFARLPLSTSMLYLGVGVALSPVWLGAADLQTLTAAPMLERLTEAVVLISLFTSGLKLSVGLQDRRWLPPLRQGSAAPPPVVRAPPSQARLDGAASGRPRGAAPVNMGSAQACVLSA